MTEENKVQFRSEGDPAFPVEPENDNSAGSPTGENEDENNADSSNGGEKKPDAQKQNVPFDQHPEWQNREKKWDERFNTQESRHQEDMRKLREEFAVGNKPKADEAKIPAWFGGDQAQWDAYKADHEAELTAKIEAATAPFKAKHAESKAIEEATAYMQSELQAIESDKTLNPSGAKLDPNALLKIVVDNDLVDSKGRWNYRAGMRMLQAQSAPKPDNKDKKALAGATGSDSKPETIPSAVKTSADFKKPGARPW